MTIIVDGTNGISGVDGTAANPAIKGNDSNTGISYGTDIVTINTGGVARVTTNASGNVGFKTTSPVSAVDVNGPSGVTSFTGTTRLGLTVRGSTDPTDYSGIDFIGYGSAITNPTARIAVVSTGGGSYIQFGTSNAYASGITNTAVSIDPSGNLLVGATSISAIVSGGSAKAFAFEPSSGYLYKGVTTGTAYGQILFYNSNGQVGQIYTDGGFTVYATTSDYRLKEITGAVTGTQAKDFIMALQPKQGTWKSDGSKFVGFLAHEFQEISPSSVFGKKDEINAEGKPVYQGMQAASSEVMANLIALVQEQQIMITELKAEFDAYKAAHP